MHDPAEVSALDRRRFLQIVGFGMSTTLGAPAFAMAQGAASPPPSKPAPPPAAAAPAAPAGPSDLSEDARSLTEIVRRRYGKHLTPDQLESVARELDGRVQGGRRLKDAKLANGDEPDFTFKA